jgi:hypothetical protein
MQLCPTILFADGASTHSPPVKQPSGGSIRRKQTIYLLQVSTDMSLKVVFGTVVRVVVLIVIFFLA